MSNGCSTEGCSSCSSEESHSHSKPSQVEYKNLLPTAKNIIGIASGKGGVGKSTVAANVAVALSKLGYKVGLLDADVFGPSISKMFGTKIGDVTVTDKKMDPIEIHGVKTMSIGNLVDPERATIWRGPLVHSAVTQMISDVNWGDIDYFILDLPPGTGDIQLSIVQSLKVDWIVAVSTPQEMSLIDVRKAIDMFQKVNVNVLGIVENMSYFVCDSCDKKHYIFGDSGAKKYAEQKNFELLGQVPIIDQIMNSGENSMPYAVADKDNIYETIASNMVKKMNSK
ncbi:MAG: Mrp/NBP35 family ATP-binding protein [Candidatus Delongbacteria bacterium]|jgi:ATP-binding protein involved in chromosome partitioning|nr:Mrp/NBP35 family ATP-binding protein [Candidatus Delongbacteria bacterium]